MSDGTSLEALQWRQMIQRVFGEALSPIAAEGLIEQLKAQALAREICPTCQAFVISPRTMQAGPDRTR